MKLSPIDAVKILGSHILRVIDVAQSVAGEVDKLRERVERLEAVNAQLCEDIEELRRQRNVDRT